MNQRKELSYLQLKKSYNPEDFSFYSTEELDALDGIIGQNRAEKSMEFGLRVKNTKYNIFVTGLKGTGKKSYIQKIVREKAQKEDIPDDWCYVYNFYDPNSPISIHMSAGMGRIFSEDMDQLVKELLEEVPKAFSDEEYELEKAEIIKEYKQSRELLLDELSKYCLENGFTIKSTTKGFALTPTQDGEAMSDEAYEKLDEEERKKIEKKAQDVEKKALEFLKKIKGIESITKDEILKLDQIVAKEIIKPYMDVLFNKYKEYKKIINYLQDVQEDMIENIYDFDLSESEREEKEENFLKRYKVNIFIDNSENEGAPVVIEYNPTYNNLIGKVEYENEQGSLKTDFTMIRPGAIHKANGGYLILQASEILMNVKSWDTLKRIMRTGTIKIESLRTQLGVVDIVSLKPEAIPISMKVILVGNPYLYSLLYAYDEDFEKLFKIKVDFDSVMDATMSRAKKMARFCKFFCTKENIRHLDPSGVAKILEYSHKIAGSQKKFTTRFNKIVELLIEADVWAELDKSLLITRDHIKKAYLEKIYRNNKIEDKIEEMYHTGKILFNLKGKEVGRIYGLSVLDLGDLMCGKPTAITVTTFCGGKGIINIEREVKMSGSIHDKGVMILEGYLSEKFAQEYPLSVTAKICFEQSYSGIDGDSASSTELYGILSSLSDVPIFQEIAVTGSVNQKGEIQPVGGVSEKIEGFFSLCKHFGLTGKQGVMIPYQNIDDLVLFDEVIDAVKEGKFHIYPISNIEEGIEILTGISFNEICKRCREKLNKFRSNIENKNHKEKRIKRR
ncbi:Lon protease family protein [Inediibacterium massiliense]|uniref:Lon protease family protein n=1 Tax=Inediibacterium massiliense TaxID=1658111 RepID=UPI0006B56401|nr:ATP-binding protein [Inediibacterium massiliense]